MAAEIRLGGTAEQTHPGRCEASPGAWDISRFQVRKRHWRLLRRVCCVGVILVTNASLLLNQTGAAAEIDRAMLASPKTYLAAGPLSFGLSQVVSGAKSMLGAASNLFSMFCPDETTSTTLSPAGTPHPWQSGVNITPYSSVNMATGNVLTEVPIVGWQSLGRPISFSFYHNTMGEDAGVMQMPTGWSHSYSRRIVYDDVADTWTLFTDQGERIVFTAGFVPQPWVVSGWVAPPGYHMWIAEGQTSGEIELLYKNQDVDVFDEENGYLIRIGDASGNWHTFNHESVLCEGDEERFILNGVIDAAGNELILENDPDLVENQCADLGAFRAGAITSIIAPPIGHPDRLKDREYDVEMDVDELSVSTARRDGIGDPIYWSRFGFNQREMEWQSDRLGTEHAIVYSLTPENEPYPVLVVNNDNANLSEPNLVTEFEFDFHTHDMTPGALSVVKESRQLGPRIYPSVAVTKFCFNADGNLISVVDPLNRTILEAEWDADRNAEVLRNVFGEETVRTFGNAGNVLTIQPPTGGDWTFTYNTQNSLTSVEDPNGAVTTLQYNLTSANPTRPILIDGPGLSDLELVWGTTSDSDLGKLVASYSPNNIEQTFTYGSPLTPNTAGIGQLKVSTFGRGDWVDNLMPTPNQPFQDRIVNSDSTGNIFASAASAHLVPASRNLSDAVCPGKEPPQVEDYAPVDAPLDDATVCCRECCTVNVDEDDNPEEFCSYKCEEDAPDPAPNPPPPPPDAPPAPDAPSEPLGNQHNGNDQPLWLIQPHQTLFGYTNYTRVQFTYDAHGRPAERETIAVPDAGGRTLYVDHYDLDVSHKFQWAYDDESGIVQRTYFQPSGTDPNGMTPLVTETRTDLAGRVTEIYENSTLIAEYTYSDDIANLPAVTETKYTRAGPGEDTVATQYWVDGSGQTSKIVHLINGGEMLAWEYGRDSKQRIDEVTEYVDGNWHAHTSFEYGSGHLTAADLDADSATAIEPDKIYYSWFANLQSLSASDPNRLVKEIRTGANAYHNQYWYDAAGNRLAMRLSRDVGETTPEYRPYELIRYNYAYAPNLDIDFQIQYNIESLFDFDPRIRSNTAAGAPGLGEPDPNSTQLHATSKNNYDAMDALGQDKLLSYTTYKFDTSKSSPMFEDTHPRYAAYVYQTHSGKMSHKYEWDGEHEELVTTGFRYEKHKLEQVRKIIVDFRGLSPKEFPTPIINYPDRYAGFLEFYAYDIFGQRSGVMYCSAGDVYQGGWAINEFPENLAPCKSHLRAFIYDETGRLMVEKRGAGGGFGGAYAMDAVYRNGPLGLLSRSANTVMGTTEDYANWCDHLTMADAMGNVQGAFADGNDPYFQTFDAFGNNVGGFAIYDCAESRRQTGQMNWRGGEGSQTDLAIDKRFEKAAESQNPTSMPADDSRMSDPYTASSTGLVYMMARYYEPEVGRFTQPDALTFQIADFMTGQSNRWVYCANDPVNLSDRSGNAWAPYLMGLVFAVAFAMGAYVGRKLNPKGLATMLDAAILGGAGYVCNKAVSGFFAKLLEAVLSGETLYLGAHANPLLRMMMDIFIIGFGLGLFVGAAFADASRKRDPANPRRAPIYIDFESPMQTLGNCALVRSENPTAQSRC